MSRGGGLLAFVSGQLLGLFRARFAFFRHSMAPPMDVFAQNCSIFWAVFLHFLDMLYLFWACFRPVLGLFWACFGLVLDLFQTCFACFRRSMVTPKDVFVLNCPILWTVSIRLLSLFYLPCACFWTYFTCHRPVLPVLGLFQTCFACLGPVLPASGAPRCPRRMFLC